jgi:putative hydrolase of the HAD superfamily
MNLKVNENSVVVFDLDDTLYKEIEFVFSAYQHIAKSLFPEKVDRIHKEMCQHFVDKKDTFTLLKQQHGLETSISELVEMYRFHLPNLTLKKSNKVLLNRIKESGGKLGILTDGRVKTQTNKLVALGIKDTVDLVVISEAIGSEKPSEANYQVFEEQFPGSSFAYIGDNFRKDFVTANRFGWTTVGLLDNGTNIHSQSGEFDSEYLPQHQVRSLEEICVS